MIERDFSKLSLNDFGTHLCGFEIQDLYKIAVSFYKEKEGKAVHLSYKDKLRLVAFTQQVSHGKFSSHKMLDLGVLDVIGRDRRAAWQALGDISREDAMRGFIILLDELCPLFKTVVEAKKYNEEEKLRLRKEEESRLKELEQLRQKEDEERLKQEQQRRLIQDALNQQTYYQFKAYAEQQYPGNPEQQGVLIRQLQEQHYHQYMQQLQKEQLIIEDQDLEEQKENFESVITSDKNPQIEEEFKEMNEAEQRDDKQDNGVQWDLVAPAEMWTRKGVEEFKDTIRKEAIEAVIKIGHGEVVTVRVPTHEDGTCLFWEFATDGYDIGFGVFFEWSKPETNQVSVHVNETDDETDVEDDDYEDRQDLESGADGESLTNDYKSSTPPITPIIPVYRRDSQEEVYAGSHQYPDQGVYLLKFDNSYSLWRSKTLYYRIYYTRPIITKM